MSVKGVVGIAGLLGLGLLSCQGSLDPGSAPGQAFDSRCPPTRADHKGPFYEPDAPVRSRVGAGYVLHGAVRSTADCSPVPGARLEMWLTGPDGDYGDDYRATLFADDAGGYRFESNFPPRYGSRPSHIHVRVTAGGYRELVTQHYPGDGATTATFDLNLWPVGR